MGAAGAGVGVIGSLRGSAGEEGGKDEEAIGEEKAAGRYVWWKR